MKSEVTRRLFLSQTALSMIGFAAAARSLSRVSNDRLSDDAGLTVRNQLLDMVNRERRDASLHILELDELACRVAEAHAIDMAQGGFLSHWGPTDVNLINVILLPGASMQLKKTTAPRTMARRSPLMRQAAI